MATKCSLLELNLEETVDRLFSHSFICSRSVNHEGLLERLIPGSVLVIGQFTMELTQIVA